MGSVNGAVSPLATGDHFSLLQGDALEVLSQLSDESFDLIFADPPYFLSNGGFTCSGGKQVAVNKGGWDKSEGIEKDFDFHRSWISACRRLLSPDGTMVVSGTYHSIFACGFALQAAGWHILNDLVWFKPNAPPNLSCRMFTASHETLIWAKKDRAARQTFNYEALKQGAFPEDPLKKPGRQMRSVWSVPPPGKEEKRFGKHPTQKPEALLERVVSATTNAGALVLDPFCGSGTTGVASLRLGRDFVGIDADATFLEELALPRLREVEGSPSLFGQ